MKSKQFIAVWVLVVIAVITAVGAGWWATEWHQVPEGALTVEQVVNGGVPQDQSVDVQLDPAENDRIVSLAEALGIPSESVPRGLLSVASDRYRSRQILETDLKKAVEAGAITKDDAKGVLAAFDAGVVAPVDGPILVESTPAE
ncbi:hypothetical protein [Corynebacterium hesseae]|uniref:hypothetical protein n=1 Tax=Corynebacterium hesseae TaxID=2913502 RepID=UPI0022B9FF3C|nr:hypothetical protein [Corynebacterium hesseae]MCZ9297214.1 hypothetical protein [Corynebacterium hesseae]